MVGLAIPILNSLGTKYGSSPGVRGLFSTLASVVAGFLLELSTEGTFELQAAVVKFVLVLGTATASYYQFYQPVGVDSAIQKRTANIGVGGSSTSA